MAQRYKHMDAFGDLVIKLQMFEDKFTYESKALHFLSLLPTSYSHNHVFCFIILGKQ